ncbi:uncharacterized protein LOC112088220 [Eutrema salsugineum]|uniref:uncharacterized protein LOC112088220 n=1 Tax=Eutrema salsugineum TaxID=72664 RepID=UPI000CED08DC|nr:uncharacterized protein LOC112088220 [Eutrema salsugineum]
MNQVLSSIGPEWNVLSNYQFSELGKIWILCKSPTTINHLFSDLQSITCEIILESGISFVYTAIYTSNDIDERKLLWSSLRDTFISFNLSERAWLVNGDFNEILSLAETSNTRISSSTAQMREFGSCLSDLGLFDLASQGPKFTWSNNRQSDPVAKKLDLCLINDQWLLLFPSGHCSFEPPEFSDHSPCHIKMFTPPPSFGSRPFKFLNLLTNHQDFLSTVKSAWEEAGDLATNLRFLCFKLKSLKRPIKSLCKENFSEIERRVFEANSILKTLQLVTLSDPTPVNLNPLFISRLLLLGKRSLYFDYKGKSYGSPFKQDSGPDGFPAEFFRASWTVIGHETTAAIKQFFTSSFIPSSLNATSLVLIPKRRGADELKDIRPISCLNTVYKIIARILSDRIKHLLPALILSNQTAFIKDMLLLENVLLASEIVQGYHLENQSPRITLMVDISKAFDSVR